MGKGFRPRRVLFLKIKRPRPKICAASGKKELTNRLIRAMMYTKQNDGGAFFISSGSRPARQNADAAKGKSAENPASVRAGGGVWAVCGIRCGLSSWIVMECCLFWLACARRLPSAQKLRTAGECPAFCYFENERPQIGCGGPEPGRQGASVLRRFIGEGTPDAVVLCPGFAPAERNKNPNWIEKACLFDIFILIIF